MGGLTEVFQIDSTYFEKPPMKIQPTNEANFEIEQKPN